MSQNKQILNYLKEGNSIDPLKGQPEFDLRRIEDLDLSVRAYNCLYAAKLYTVQAIRDVGADGLLKCRNFGRKTIEELEKLKIID